MAECSPPRRRAEVNVTSLTRLRQAVRRRRWHVGWLASAVSTEPSPYRHACHVRCGAANRRRPIHSRSIS